MDRLSELRAQAFGGDSDPDGDRLDSLRSQAFPDEGGDEGDRAAQLRAQAFGDEDEGTGFGKLASRVGGAVKGAAAKVLTETVDAGLAGLRGISRASDPFDTNPFDDVFRSQLHRKNPDRNIELGDALALERPERNKREEELQKALDELAERGKRDGLTTEQIATGAAQADLLGNVTREAAFAVPSGGLASAGRKLVGRAIGGVAPKVPALASRLRQAPALSGALDETAKALVEFPLFTGTREGIETGEFGEEAVGVAKSSLVGDVDLGPVTVPNVPFFLLGTAGGFARGARFRRDAILNNSRAVVRDTGAGGRVVDFPNGVTLTEEEANILLARADVNRNTPGLTQADIPGQIEALGPGSAITPSRRAGRPAVDPVPDVAPGRPTAGLLTAGDPPPPAPQPVRPKIREFSVGQDNFRIAEVPGNGGVLVRNGEIIAEMPSNKNVLVVAKEASQELLTQAEMVARDLAEERTSLLASERGIAILDPENAPEFVKTARAAGRRARPGLLREDFTDDATPFMETIYAEPGDIDGLFHVTTNAPAVERGGLLSRNRLGMTEGLGGGPNNKVSVTHSSAKAQVLEDDIRMAARAARDEVPADEILDHFLLKAGSDDIAFLTEQVGLSYEIENLAYRHTGVRTNGMDNILNLIEEIPNKVNRARAKYELVQELDTLLSGGGIDSRFRTGLLASFEDMVRINPDHVKALNVRVRKNAVSQHIPQELELRFDFSDVEFIRGDSNTALTAGRAPRVARNADGSLVNPLRDERGVTRLDSPGGRRRAETEARAAAREIAARDAQKKRGAKLINKLESDRRAVAQATLEGRAGRAKLLRDFTFNRAVNFTNKLGPGGQRISEGIVRIDDAIAGRRGENLAAARLVLKGLNRQSRERVVLAINERFPLDQLTKAEAKAVGPLRAVLDRDLIAAREAGMTRKLPNVSQASRGKIARAVLGESQEQLTAFEAEMVRRVREFKDGGIAEAARLKRSGNDVRFPVGGSGKAAPEIPNRLGERMLRAVRERGLSDPDVASVVAEMRAAHPGLSEEAAIRRLEYAHEQHVRGLNQYFEGTRVELPSRFLRLDPESWLQRHFDRTARTVEFVREFGDNGAAANEALLRIRQDFDAGTSLKVRQYIRQEFGGEQASPSFVTAVTGPLSNFQTVTKLGLSVLSATRNYGQRFVNNADQPLISQLRALKANPPFVGKYLKESQKLIDEVERAGGVQAESSILAAIERGDLGDEAVQFALKPFLKVERGNQIKTGIVAKFALEDNLNIIARFGEENVGGGTLPAANTSLGQSMRALGNFMRTLSTNPSAAAARRLGKMGLEDDVIREVLATGREFTAEEVQRAIFRSVRDRQFPLTVASQRTWWTTMPVFRQLAKFKPFGVEQTYFLYNNGLKELTRGNAAPMVKFIVAAEMMGEVYNVAREILTGKDENLFAGEIAKIFTEEEFSAQRAVLLASRNIGDAGGLGIMTDLMYGIDEFILGPSAGTLRRSLGVFASVWRRPDLRQAQSVAFDFVKSEVPVTKQIEGVFRRGEAMLFRENKTWLENQKWRMKAREFESTIEDPTIPGRLQTAGIRALTGSPRFPESERTISLRHAAGQIDANDIDGASDFLAHVFLSKPKEEWDEAEKGMRTSMRNRSPISSGGRLNADEQAAFLQTLTPEERKELFRVQTKFKIDYERAIAEARKKASSANFIERNITGPR